MTDRSELQLCSPPVSPLSVVSDLIVCLIPNPVWHGTILLDLFAESDLLSECLDRTLKTVSTKRGTLPLLFYYCYLINNLSQTHYLLHIP